MEYKTSVFYAGGGSTYTFPFEYLQKSFVKVRYQKPDGAFQNLEFGKDYTVEENRVNLTAASDSTYKVNIYRSTPTDRMVKYVDASILKAHDMNVNELQTLHIMEEQTDYLTAYALFRGDNANVWEANTLRIINIATPLEPTDAVNKAYVDEYGVTWNQNVAQMKKQLQDQNTNITNQLDTQNRNITKQLADQQTLFNQQLSDQDTSFNGRIAEHDTELLNKVDTNNQKYKTELQTYNDGVVKQIHDDAGASAALAKKWAQDAGSPDNESDSVSPTGKTQSAKSWAEVAKSQAQASSTSAAEAKKSQSAASTSEQNAKSFMEAASTSANASLRSQEASASSESKAKASEDNAKQSELNAAESAKQAAAGQINADWAENDETSKAFIKNKSLVATQEELNQTLDALGDALSSGITTQTLTVTGETNVPTANAGNSSNAIASTEFVAKSIASLVDSAPETLNTLNEIATALGNDPNFSTTVLTALGKKMGSAEAESTFAKKTDCPFPVGAAFIEFNGLTPSTIWPGTTWELTAPGRVLIGAGKADSGTTYTLGAKGGNENIILNTNNLPPHTHTASINKVNLSGNFRTGVEKSGTGIINTKVVSNDGVGLRESSTTHLVTVNASHSHSVTIGSTGSGKGFSIMEPYQVVNIWKRLS